MLHPQVRLLRTTSQSWILYLFVLFQESVAPPPAPDVRPQQAGTASVFAHRLLLSA